MNDDGQLVELVVPDDVVGAVLSEVVVPQRIIFSRGVMNSETSWRGRRGSGRHSHARARHNAHEVSDRGVGGCRRR